MDNSSPNKFVCACCWLRRMVLTFFSLTILPASNVQAKSWEYSNLQQGKSYFFLGFLSGYLTHEVGHVVVAKSKGYSVRLDGLTIIYPDLVRGTSDHLQISAAGFQAQWLVSEAALRYRESRYLSVDADNFNAG
jgi:uncharacterized membrane protein